MPIEQFVMLEAWYLHEVDGLRTMFLTPNILCEHNLVMNNSLYPFDTSSDGFWIVLSIPHAHVYVYYVRSCG